MKTSYRVIAKAKKKIVEGRPVRPWERIAIKRGYEKLRRRRQNAIRISMAALAAAFGAFNIATIRATAGASALEKSVSITSSIINTAFAVSKAMQTEVL